MNKFDKKLRKAAQNEKFEIPEQVKTKLENTLHSLPDKKIKTKRIKLLPQIAAAAACFIFVMLFVLPNVSVTYAQSFENIPVLNDIIRVVTIRNYFYSDDYHEMKVDIPEIDDKQNTEAAQNINKDVTALTEEIVKEFYKEVEEIGNDGHGAVYVDYDIVTNTDKWFTLKLTVTSVRGSGSVYFKYYHINRETGENVILSDLFKTDVYSGIITENIKEQMRNRMKSDSDLTYWVDSADGFDFAAISDSHNFYINEDGNLVIPFDKYEVAPGYMGHSEFVIEKGILKNIIKEDYKFLLK
ncbi:MAG: DUF3298 and DUF4163 domain-containing protein [Eubacterium sp.]